MGNETNGRRTRRSRYGIPPKQVLVGTICFVLLGVCVQGFTSAKLADMLLKGWIAEAVPLTKRKNLNRIEQLLQKNNKTGSGVPGFFYGVFQTPEEEELPDTLLDPTNWTKGVAFVNGINLGRYWPVTGPQITLCVPAPFLRPYPEVNSVMLFETKRAPSDNLTVHFIDKPRINASVPNPQP